MGADGLMNISSKQIILSEEVTTIIMGYHALPGCDRTLFNCLSRLVVRACWNRCSDLRELVS